MPRIFLLQQELFLQQDRLEEDVGRTQAKTAAVPALDIEKDIFTAPADPPPPKPVVSSVEVVKNHFEIRDLTTSEQYHYHEHDDEKAKDSDDITGPTQIEGKYRQKSTIVFYANFNERIQTCLHEIVQSWND